MTSSAPDRPFTAGEPARRAARVVALAFGAVAVAGFVPGLTADLGRIAPAGWGSGAVLLGVLRVSVIGNLIHLAMAGAGLLASDSEQKSRSYLLWGGACYFALSCHRLLIARLVVGTQVPGRGIGEWLPIAAGLAMMLTALHTRAVATPTSR